MQDRDRTAVVVTRGRAPRWIRVATVATLLGLVFGALGPFGSYLNDGIVARTAYWVGSTWSGLLLYGGAFAISERFSERHSWRRWALLGLSVLVASLPEAVITHAAAFLIWPALHRHGPGWWLWYVQVTTIGAIILLGKTVLLDGRSRHSPPMASPALAMTQDGGKTGSRGDRPVWLPADVIALQMEDHYVRIHTPAGSTLVLMPLTQAIEQIALLEGLRTHRSWWVARHAVVHVEGSPRSMRLHLSNGVSAPVARSAVVTLREAGWLTGKPAA